MPRNAARLLAAMFPSEDVCQRSLQVIAEEGFNRKNLSSVLKHLVEAGFLSSYPGSRAGGSAGRSPGPSWTCWGPGCGLPPELREHCSGHRAPAARLPRR